MKFHIKTYGCQMNDYDAEAMGQLLQKKGFVPAGTAQEADVCIIETCSVRQKAEDKVIGLIGQLAKRKREKGAPLIVVAGCMAERMKEGLRERFPEVDLVIGPDHISEIAERISDISSREENSSRLTATGFDRLTRNIYRKGLYRYFRGIQAYVTVIRGCTNYCSYCVVPYVRGPECSRAPEDILDEISELAAAGCKEVTLLGQNINAYGKDLGSPLSFTELLAKIVKGTDVPRIRFVTSHPKDTPADLIRFMRENARVCPYLHMPVQSGSDRVLKKMNRGYTRGEYMEKIEEFRRICPELSFSTDVIVGYPGEEEEDFRMTVELLERVRFDSAFIFKYSDRSGTGAAGEEGKVSRNEVVRRHEKVLSLQNRITHEKNLKDAGRTFEVLVEGVSRTDRTRYTGRTEHNKIAVFPAQEKIVPGRIMKMKVISASPHSLYCEPLD